MQPGGLCRRAPPSQDGNAPPPPAPSQRRFQPPGKALLAAKLAKVAATSTRVHVDLKEKERELQSPAFPFQ